MNREDLIKLIKNIKSCNYPSEEESDLAIEHLINNVSDPQAIDYIFQKEFENLSAENIADKIIDYKVIRL